MQLSFGYIETRGFVGAIEAADAMLKAASVSLIKTEQVGSGLVTVIIEGPLDACQAAVDAGKAAADRIGELISSHVIAHPYVDTEFLTKGKDKAVPITKKPKAQQTKKPKTTKVSEKVSTADKVAALIIKSESKGIAMDKIINELDLPLKEARLIIKELMDAEKIERIQKLYYWIGKK